MVVLRAVELGDRDLRILIATLPSFARLLHFAHLALGGRVHYTVYVRHFYMFFSSILFPSFVIVVAATYSLLADRINRGNSRSIQVSHEREEGPEKEKRRQREREDRAKKNWCSNPRSSFSTLIWKKKKVIGKGD